MKIRGNTVLITGGATGIGLAMAKEFVKGGSEVIHLREDGRDPETGQSQAAVAAT